MNKVAQASAGPLSLTLEQASAVLESMRPRQWIKNGVVLAAAIFSRRLMEPRTIGLALAAALVFCVLSGAVYILNDLMDRERDRLHPEKRRRPIPSGRLSPAMGWGAANGLGALAIAGAVGLGWPFALTALAYVCIQVAYSLRLKQVVLVDVFCIAAGFVLRAVAGAEAIEVEISSWLLICTILLALFLALAKRRQELVALADGASAHRAILGEYSPTLLDQLMAVTTAATVVTYALYTMAPETVARFHTTNLKFTVPVVIFGIFRYLYLVHRRNGGGSPERILLEDRPMLATILLYLVLVLGIIYTGSGDGHKVPGGKSPAGSRLHGTAGEQAGAVAAGPEERGGR